MCRSNLPRFKGVVWDDTRYAKAEDDPVWQHWFRKMRQEHSVPRDDGRTLLTLAEIADEEDAR